MNTINNNNNNTYYIPKNNFENILNNPFDKKSVHMTLLFRIGEFLGINSVINAIKQNIVIALFIKIIILFRILITIILIIVLLLAIVYLFRNKLPYVVFIVIILIIVYGYNLKSEIRIL